MTESRLQSIERLLRDAFAPSELLVKDQSHLHEGHAGAQDGKGHFEVTIVSDQFDGMGRISRHRIIYDALGGLMETDIHALRINADSPSDR